MGKRRYTPPAPALPRLVRVTEELRNRNDNWLKWRRLHKVESGGTRWEPYSKTPRCGIRWYTTEYIDGKENKKVR